MEKTDFILLGRQEEQEFTELLSRIRNLQSGGTIDSLEAIGASTRGQIGASYVSLKNLAADYLPDEKVAFLLWRQARREEQIVSCFLLPASLNKEKIMQFMKSCTSFEIAGYFGSIFLHRHPGLSEITEEWMASENPFLQTAALSAAARHRILNPDSKLVSEERFSEMTGRRYENRYVELVAQRYRFNN